ncbi:MAG: HypC/HybG/HupF family hydrogenase formation chaperone [Parcubacteria group bacterium CG10_big_fil_rev_8_21_14_0_10_36_14]|nr:MAG: HypC/HybG/HupF family hydrogenase formation chaperone [Parcubacteria group bacterium CG10_big_fil_rev_8_21_14_0_10_36_14]
MCLTIPAQIIQLTGNYAKVKDKNFNIKISLIPDICIGDWVLLHADLAIKKITKEEAEEINNLYAQYEK